jgi:hypothetical protein
VSDAEQSNDPPQQPPADSPRRASAPGAVQAAAILLCVGGGLTVVFALAGLGSGALLRSAAYALYGLLWLGLGYAVHGGRRWARRAVLVLCTVGAALAGIRLVVSGVSEGISALAWPLVYAILLSTTPARAWFHRDRPAA